MKEKSEQIQNKDDTIAYIKFYNEIKKLKMIDDFTEMKKKICNILQLKEESFKLLTLSYKDEDGDTIQVVTEEDYNILFDQMKTKQVDILNIGVSENSDVNIEECLSSIVKFKENFDDEEKQKNMNNINIISSQCFEINKQEKPQVNIEIKEKEKEDNESNINKDIINNDNINNENNINKDNNNEDNINNENNINDDNNISNENNINKDNINNDNSNNENNGNINNDRNINNNNKFFMQGNASPFIPNNNNVINNSAYNIPMTMVFPYNCNLCNKYPIVNVLYHCPKCSIFLCQDCEEKLGINHRHSILKAQTKQQFDDLNIKINYDIKGDYSNDNNNNLNENDSQIGKYAHLVKDKISDTLGGVFNIINNTLNNNSNQNNQANNNANDNNINNNINNINNNNNNNQQVGPQQMSLIQLARTQYNLEGVTNEQLEDALKKTNGKIDDAILTLFQ